MCFGWSQGEWNRACGFEWFRRSYRLTRLELFTKVQFSLEITLPNPHPVSTASRLLMSLGILSRTHTSASHPSPSHDILSAFPLPLSPPPLPPLRKKRKKAVQKKKTTHDNNMINRNLNLTPHLLQLDLSRPISARFVSRMVFIRDLAVDHQIHLVVAVGVDLDGAVVAAGDVGPYCFAEVADFWKGVKDIGSVRWW